MAVEPRDLEYFAVVAERGNLGRAAEALELSQPALSKSLRRLEGWAGTKLVKRTPKGVELTPIGSALLEHAHRLRLSLHDIGRAMADLSGGRVGSLRVGAGPLMVEAILPAACEALLKYAPNLDFKVEVSMNDVLMPALRNGELDLVVSGIPPATHEDLVQEYLYDDEFVVYASADHRLAKRKGVTMEDLVRERWATAPAAVLSWNWMHRAFEDRGLPPPRTTLRTSSASLALHAVSRSDLLGFTSRRNLRQAMQRLRLVEISVKAMPWRRRVGISYRKDGYLSPAAKRFIEILKETAKEIVI
jgi:DNA-binding transcriptional LysR family regulator